MMTELDIFSDARLRTRVAGLALTTSLMLALPAWADEETDVTDELEVTLEVFDDSASLEGFELRLTDPAEMDDHDVIEGDGEHQDLAERMARFEEEVREASDLDDRESDERRSEERDAEMDREEAAAADHDENRLEQLAEFDEADEMDEVDLAEPEEDGEDAMDDAATDGEMADGEMAEGELVDEPIGDVEEVMEEETDELSEEVPPAGEDDVLT